MDWNSRRPLPVYEPFRPHSTAYSRIYTCRVARYKDAVRIDRCGADDSQMGEYDLLPSKIVGVGVNYRAHALEMNKPIPKEPLIFLKPPSAIIASNCPIRLPGGYKRVDFEAELGVVIGKKCAQISQEKALDVVLGFVCVNDVTVRDLQRSDGQWTRAKGFDTFCPIGPRIVCGSSPSDLQIVARVNGETRQCSSTADMIFSVPEIISFVSHVMTLEEGDVITTGTPQGVGKLSPGDVVEIEVETIGTLRNPVEAAIERN